MKQRSWRAGWLAAAALSVLGACTDSTPVAPTAGSGTPGGPGSGAANLNIEAVRCVGSPASHTVSCEQPAPGGGSSDIIVGGQNIYVSVHTQNVNYDAGTGDFSFDLSVRNLIPQPMGTTDAVTLAPDPNGVQLFFHQGPTVTAGSGTITVVGDGVGTFTAANQPFYRYSTVLEQYEVSSNRTWHLTMPSTVTSFDFRLYVSTPVPFPNGYIDVSANPNLREGTERTLTGVVRTPVGEIDAAATNADWQVSAGDQLLADYVSETGASCVVHGYRFGHPVMTITADRVVSGGSATVSGAITLNVLPVRRLWTGVENSDWSNGHNWLPDSVAPVPQDSAVVPDSVTTFPSLTQNVSIAGLEVLDLAPGGTVPTVSLGAFNLDASGDVLTTNSGAINNTSGVLALTGIGRTVAGTLPFMRVNGTYSLNGNVTGRAPVRVDLGRLTNTSFRVQATSF